MGARPAGDRDLLPVDELVRQITVDAHSDDEKLQAFRQAFEDRAAAPCDAFVIGEPISVVAFEYDGNARRGLTATCRRPDGTEHVVSACDVEFFPHTEGGRLAAAYRRWLGLESFAFASSVGAWPRSRHKVAPADIDVGALVELVILSLTEQAARCRLLRSDREITLRATRLWNVVLGEIVVVKPRKQWSYAGHPYLSGEITSTRLHAKALGLAPLRLEGQGTWDPAGEYWGEDDEPIEAWAKPIIARGPRPELETEQVLPGADPDEPESDLILEVRRQPCRLQLATTS
jgi:hypothetical protein